MSSIKIRVKQSCNSECLLTLLFVAFLILQVTSLFKLYDLNNSMDRLIYVLELARDEEN